MKSYRQLFIWVEGEDDERFFAHILKPKLQKKYDRVEIRKYARMKKEKVDRFLRSIQSMGADFLYVVDIDKSPCVRARKQEVMRVLRSLKMEKIVVVRSEIEGWYLAGLDESVLRS
ncbi:hypothetical protein DRP53_02060 [candidate division WOR-3 bacterium]|uniref:DUF4276 family protein n=1 Tax=candidate division WOR-3 bacterium TaxID=2052148 RepID=A0A660SKG4_UNCW3|nr:MAG: hypothetical protein DRP53_02060 [candidate division WOR-3 bacterium]